MYENLALLALFTFVYGVIAGRLERTAVNGPVVYLLFGVLAGPLGLGLLDLQISGEGIRTIAELTLALVLFADASNADLGVLRRTFQLPQRLLLIGLPLTILLGVVVGRLLFPELGWITLAILATLLAPTDAALGAAVVRNPVVPATIREGLNVESGLNDGICVPVLFTFLALASQADGAGSSRELALRLVAEQIGIGAVVGSGLAVTAAAILRLAERQGWLDEAWMGIPIIALAFGIFALTQLAGGSGFIACFTGGLVFGALAGAKKRSALEGAEETGKVFSLVTWIVFGTAVVSRFAEQLEWRVVLYAVLSLSVVRMLPVFLAVLGLGLRMDAKLFIGWFGPRGLASIVFLVIVAHERLPEVGTLAVVTVATVGMSILAHGLSANPLATAFGARAQSEPRVMLP